MHYKFDAFGRLESPTLVLCEISKERLCTLFLKDEPILDINFTDISTLNFNVPKTIDGEDYQYYDLVQELRMIYIPNIGYFQLTEPIEKSDGIVTYKECTALSAESMLQSKRVTNIKGEYKLWNPIKPYESLMGILLSIAPGWKVGNVDGIILTRQRTIDITEGDLYSIMTNDFYSSFEAIFVFDYDNFEINIYDANKEFRETEIFMSFHNLLKEVTVTPQTDGVVTALRVLGGDGLDISGVNPTGDTIYNVSYFIDRMSKDLQAAYKAYESKYNKLIPVYSALLVSYKNKSAEISALQNSAPEYSVNFQANKDGTATISPALTISSGLFQLKAALKTLENIKSIRIAQGNISFADVNSIMASAENLIAQKETSIATAELQLQDIGNQIAVINADLKMEANFTNDEWIELNGYFRYSTLQENGYTIRDNMTQDEKQAIRMELLDYGKLVLEKSCVPKYLFEISAVNFMALPEFQKFHEQFELGSTFTLKINDNYTVKPLLLGVHINYNDLKDFKLKYGNKTRINDGFDFSAYRQSINVSSNIAFDLIKLEAMKQQNDDVTEFINGALDLAVNNLVTNDKRVDIALNENGLRIKEHEYTTNKLLPQELWITGKQIVFSKDNFKTAELAIGEIKVPGSIGGKTYGLIAPVIVGRLIAGNLLHISNQNNNFRLDETGCWLDNANFTLTKTKSGVTNKIVLDANEGFSIYKGTQKKIYLGTDGNIKIDGDILAGSININEQFAVDSKGNVTIRSGTINIGNGQFTVDASGNVAIKTGTINIGNGKFVVDATGSLTANNANIKGKIESSTINASTLIGGSIEGTSIKVGKDQFIVDANGKLTANNAVIKGTVEGSSFLGGNIDIGNGQFKVDKDGNVSINRGSIDIGRGQFSIDDKGNVVIKRGSIDIGDGHFVVDNTGNISIKRGSIDIGSGNFVVDKYGKISIKSGSIDLGSGKFIVESNGKVTAKDAQIEGTIKGSSFIGGSINIGNDQFKVDLNGNVTIKSGSIDIGSRQFEVDSSGNVSIKKGSIDLGNGQFTVDSNGNIVIRRGSIDIGTGKFTVDSTGKLTAREAVIKGSIEGSSFSGGNINIGDGQFTVDSFGNVAIRRGDLDIGNGKFNVDAVGNVTMRYADIQGGMIKLGNTTITESSLQARGAWLDSTSVYDGMIKGNQIFSNSITSGHIEAGSITAEKIAAGAIVAEKIAAYSIYADKLAAGSITDEKIAAGAITADKLAAGSITADKIAAGSVTADKIVADGLIVTKIYGTDYYGRASGYLRVMYNSNSAAGIELINGQGGSIYSVSDWGNGWIDFSARGNLFMQIEQTGGLAVGCYGRWNFAQGIDASNIKMASGSDLQQRMVDYYNDIENLKSRVAALERK